MQFGLNKFASLSIRQGEVQAVVTPQLEGILSLAEGIEYKYLGVLVSKVFDVTQMKIPVHQQFFQHSSKNNLEDSIKFWE